MKKKMMPVMATIVVMAAAVNICSVDVYAADSLEDVDISALTSGDYDVIIDELKEALKDGDIESGEDIQDFISQKEDEYGVEVDNDLQDKVADIYDKATAMGVDQDKLADLIDDVYDKVLSGKTYESADDAIDAIEKQVVDSATQVVKDSIKRSIGEYFKDFTEHIKNMWGELLSKWKS